MSRLAGILAVAWMAGSVPAAEAKIDAGDLENGSTTVVQDFPAAATSPTGGYVACPAGSRIFTGGAYWIQPGGSGAPVADLVGLNVTGTTPTFQGDGWYADAANNTQDAYTLRVIARCLAKRKLNSAVIRVKTAEVAADDVIDREVKCPKGDRVISGGAFWHDVGPDSGPEPAEAGIGTLASSSPVSDRSWYVSGATVTTAAREISIVARCLKSKKLSGYDLTRRIVGVGDGEASAATVRCRGGSRIGPAGVLVNEPGKDPNAKDAEWSYLTAAGVREFRDTFVGGMWRISNPFVNVEVRGYCLKP